MDSKNSIIFSCTDCNQSFSISTDSDGFTSALTVDQGAGDNITVGSSSEARLHTIETIIN